jgi:hypothetical protein
MTHRRESANLMWRNLEHVTRDGDVLRVRQDEEVHAARSAEARGATHTARRGRTAPVASVATRRCVGPTGRGRELSRALRRETPAISIS